MAVVVSAIVCIAFDFRILLLLEVRLATTAAIATQDNANATMLKESVSSLWKV